MNLKDQELKIFRELSSGNYTIEETHITGFVSPLALGDIQVSVQRLMNP